MTRLVWSCWESGVWKAWADARHADPTTRRYTVWRPGGQRRAWAATVTIHTPRRHLPGGQGRLPTAPRRTGADIMTPVRKRPR